ncbi:MAG TPA: ribosome maturation factor RimP [Thermoanaerobaculia bacterium]|nr:ribosome maturation factor RimP [Thermoanaerobaculia bacterium]
MQLPETVEQEIRKVVEAEGFELVNVEYRRHGRTALLRVDIDNEKGITLGDCELISRQLSAFLDVEDPIESEYELQVSSPGLDRKFHRSSDYERFLGRLIRVRTSQAVGGLHVIVGHLSSLDGDRIVVVDPKTKAKKEYEIELANIKETRLEPEIG